MGKLMKHELLDHLPAVEVGRQEQGPLQQLPLLLGLLRDL